MIYVSDSPDGLSSNAKLFVVHYILNSASDLHKNWKTVSEWAFQWEMSFNPDQNKQAQGVIFRSKSTNIQLYKSLSKHSTKTFKSQAWTSGGVLRNFAKFTGKHLWQSLFFIYFAWIYFRESKIMGFFEWTNSRECQKLLLRKLKTTYSFYKNVKRKTTFSVHKNVKICVITYWSHNIPKDINQ